MTRKKHSTGTLSDEQCARQESLYREGHTYDYLIIGTGMSALSAGALLAKAGYRVCMLEAHDSPGGYAHTFAFQGFHFSAAVNYIWGCAPGQTIHQFLEHLDLVDEISFEVLDPEGYDHVALPDGKQMKIPYGFDQLIDNLEAAYPGQRQGLKRFFSVISSLRDEIKLIPYPPRWWHYLTVGYKCLTVIKYQHKTLQDLFDECELSKEVQAVLCADAGDFGAPPENLSILAYTSLFSGYNEGAYYPTKHLKFFIERIAQFITDQKGCHIFYETEATQITVEDKQVVEVGTADGKVFTANQYICNMDPQKASYLIGREKFPQPYLPALSYEYSPSSFLIYLGIKDIDLRNHGFGAFNIWHLEQWDMNKMWQEIMTGNYDNPWIFISSPSLRTPNPSDAPEGCQTLEVGCAANYAYFQKLRTENPEKYHQECEKIRDRLLDIVEEKYIPNLREHIAVMVSGSPTVNEDFVLAPHGNCYGSNITPKNMGWNRLQADTPWKNLFWCNASAGYAGVHGTTMTGMSLYTKLTGEKVFSLKKQPLPADAICCAKGQAR